MTTLKIKQFTRMVISSSQRTHGVKDHDTIQSTRKSGKYPSVACKNVVSRVSFTCQDSPSVSRNGTCVQCTCLLSVPIFGSKVHIFFDECGKLGVCFNPLRNLQSCSGCALKVCDKTTAIKQQKAPAAGTRTATLRRLFRGSVSTYLFGIRPECQTATFHTGDPWPGLLYRRSCDLRTRIHWT